MGLSIVSPPVNYPVTLEEAKMQLKLDGDNSQDDHVTLMIMAATRAVERYIGKSLMERTMRLTLDQFSDAIELPRGPVTAIVQVNYVDEEGFSQTVPAGDYTLDTTSPIAWLVRNSGAAWPSVLSAINVVEIDYLAGYDDLPPDFADVKMAILVLIQQFESRSSDPKMAEAMDKSVASLLKPFGWTMV